MKQFIYASNDTYGTLDNSNDLTQLAKGQIEAFNLSDNTKVIDASENFCIALGRGTNLVPFIIPEVDVKTLKVTKTDYAAGAKFTSSVLFPSSTVKDAIYGIIIVKKGVQFNERNKWSYVVKATSTSNQSLIDEFVKLINANMEGSSNETILGITAYASGANSLSLTGNTYQDYEIVLTDNMKDGKIQSVTHAKTPILDKTFVEDLAQRCVAGKGIKYLGEDGADIYPGYPEVIKDQQHTMFTLRFAVPRVAAKQRDEVVYQLVHIVCKKGSSVETTFNSFINPAAGASLPETHILDNDDLVNDGDNGLGE